MADIISWRSYFRSNQDVLEGGHPTKDVLEGGHPNQE